ncbi:MAG TPA: hypothetical protein VKU87_07740 [Thermomicrobiaceae bacterium]|nr:hypothetical protein [Thermomicrobiaceae bacterium]
MANQTKTIHIEPGSELDRILAEADLEPVEVNVGDRRYWISRLGSAERSIVPRLAD